MEDDEFGDLYADVELQAGLAINSISKPHQHHNDTAAPLPHKTETNSKNLVMKSGNNAQTVKPKVKNGFSNLPNAKRREFEKVGYGSKEFGGGGEWRESGWRQIQGLNSGFAGYGYGFSVPWYRTPGVDVSNYFNYGFTNDSWRQYCVSMEPLRQQQYVHGYDLAKRYTAYNTRPYHERTQPTIDEDVNQVGSSSKYEKEVRHLRLPISKAIQVERQPTVVMSPQNVDDSDVVIKINVQDSFHESSGCVEKKFSPADKSRSEKYKSRNSTVKDTRIVQSSSSVGGDNLSAESLQENNRCTLTLERCSSLESGEMSRDRDIHENTLVFDKDGNRRQKEVAQASEHNCRSVERSKNEEEKIETTESKLNQCLVKKDITQGDQSQSEGSLSYASSDSGSPEGSVFSFAKESYGQLERSCSGTELQDSISNERNSSKGNSAIRESVSRRSYSNDRHPVQEEEKIQDGRLSRVVEQRIQHDNNHPSSRVYSSHRSRWIERQHELDSNRRDDFTNRKDRYFSRDNDDGRFLDKDVQDNYNRHPRRKYHLTFKDKEESHDWTWNEDPCRTNFGFCSKKDLVLEREDRHSYKREAPYQDNIPINYEVCRRYDFKGEMVRGRGKNENLQTAKIDNFATRFPDRKSDLVQDKYGKSISYVNLRKGHFDERREGPRSYTGRNIYPFAKRVRYTDDSSMDFDNSWDINTENGHQNLACRPFRESYGSEDERFVDRMPIATDMCKSRLTEEYGTHGRKLFDDDARFSGCHESWNDRPNVKDRLMYPDNEFRLGRSRYRELGNGRESIPRNGFNDFFAERIVYPFERNAKDGNDGLLVDHRPAEHHRNKYSLTREDYRSVLRKNHGMIRDGEPENIVSRCGYPVDMTVGNGKSSGRYFDGRGRTVNNKFRPMNMELDEKHTISKKFSESLSRKTTEMGILKTEVKQFDQKWFGKAAATYSNFDMDLEEGQIPEEPKMKKSSNLNRGSDIAMPNHKMRISKTEIDSGRNETTRELDDQQILESLAKMERRRERFKDPIMPKQEPDNSAHTCSDQLVGAIESGEHGKPYRKRQWIGG